MIHAVVAWSFGLCYTNGKEKPEGLTLLLIIGVLTISLTFFSI
jgi:hypothetical protein